MRYRVTYRKPFVGEEEEEPLSAEELLGLPADVIRDAKLVEETDPPEEADDDLLEFGTEVWDYDVTPGREGEFEYAIQNSELAIEMIELDEAETDQASSGTST